MVILNAVVSTINVALVLLILLFVKEEHPQAGRYGFGFLVFLLAVNTTLIWW